jgi:hypothetical protein
VRAHVAVDEAAVDELPVELGEPAQTDELHLRRVRLAQVLDLLMDELVDVLFLVVEDAVRDEAHFVGRVAQHLLQQRIRDLRRHALEREQ